MIRPGPGFEVVTGAAPDPYQQRIERAYGDDPAIWQVAIGAELRFCFGLYSPRGSNSLDQVGERYFDRQLELAGIWRGTQLRRVLDVGFGWGASLVHLARRQPGCPRIDGINVSERQVRHAADRIANSELTDRVRLYLGNAKDVASIPDPTPRYDLVVLRGVIAHLPPAVLDATLRGIATRTAPGARIVISGTFHAVPVAHRRPPIADDLDRLALGHRTSVSTVVGLLERCSFMITDLRELPEVDDAIRWLDAVRGNIERDPARPLPRAIAELRDVADNLSMALDTGLAGVYSVIARRLPAG